MSLASRLAVLERKTATSAESITILIYRQDDTGNEIATAIIRARDAKPGDSLVLCRADGETEGAFLSRVDRQQGP